jgi:hypothetical protein
MGARVFRDGGPPSTATVALIPCEPACRTKMEVPDPVKEYCIEHKSLVLHAPYVNVPS